MLESLKDEARSAFSTLRHRRGVAAAVITTLSFGIAAATAIFAVVDAVLLKPLPYPEPERIVTLWNRYGTTRTASSPPDYMDRRRESHLLEATASWASRSANLFVAGEARRVETTQVTSDFFRVMGVEPLMGAAVLPEETSGSGERIAILSFGLWQSVYGGEPIAGLSIHLDGESYLVTGVLPRGFDFPAGTDVFLPLVFTPEELGDGYRGNEYLFEVARMKPGVEIAELSREVTAIAASVLDRVPRRREFLERNGFGAGVLSLRDHLVGETKSAFSMLAVAVFVVLLVTGANVAHILLASGTSRYAELAVRLSLGATRGRLFLHLVAESVLLSMAGGVLGLGLAAFIVRAASRLLASELPGASGIALDARAVLFTFLVALATGILCAIVPARLASGSSMRTAPRSSPTAGARRLRSALVVSQVALALVLLIAAGLLVRSFQRLTSRDPGFEPAGRVGFGLDLPQALYPRWEEREALARELLERLRVLPGVRSVGASARTPLGGNPWTGTFRPEGFDLAPGVPVPGADFNVVSPNYRAALGIPLLRGRDFTSADDSNSTPVVLVDRWTEERFWPQGAVGGRIDVGRDLYEIVGVVGHVPYESLDERGRFQLYFPVFQRDWWRHLDFTLQAEADAAALIPSARAEVADIAPDLAVHSVRTLNGLVADSLAFRELQATLLAAFGMLALALAASGIYGVVAYSVSQRRREVGLRMALGATPKRILGLILKEGFILGALGVPLGWMGALASTRLLSELLYGIEPTDGVSYFTVTAALSVVALAAALIPALRASRTDPWSTLRAE